MAEETEVARLVARITADASLLNTELEKSRKKVEQESSFMSRAMTGFQTKLRDVGTEMLKFRTLTVAAAGVGGLAMLAKSAINAAGELTDFSDQAQVSTDTIQEMQYAGLEFGVKSDEMVQSLVYFNKMLGEFATTGQGEAAETFKRIGLQAEIASGRVTNTQQAFDYIKANFSKFYTSSTAASGAAELFGRRAGTKLAPLLMAGGAALDDYARRAHETGYVMERDLLDTADQAGDNIEKLTGVIKNNLTRGLIEGFADEFGNFAELLESEAFKSSVREFGENMATLAKQITELAKYAPKLAAAWGAAKVTPGPPWAKALAAGGGYLAADMAGRDTSGTLGEYLGFIDKAPLGPEESDEEAAAKHQKGMLRFAPGWASSGNGSQSNWINKVFGKHEETKPSLPLVQPPNPIKNNPDAELIKDLQLRVELQKKLNLGKEREAEIKAVLARLSPQATKDQRALAAQLAGEGYDLKKAQEQKKVTDEANKAIDDQVAELMRRSKVLAQSERDAYIAGEAAKAEETLAKAVKDGNMSLDERAKKLETVKDAAGKAFDAKKQNESAQAISGTFQNAFDTAGDSIARMAAQGKLSLNSLASVSQTVSQEIMATFIKLALINPLENAIFGDVEGYSSKPTISVLSELSSLFGGGKADGGGVDPTKYYVVGEEGPELFIPNRAGRIVSNAQLSSGSSTVNHNNQSVHLHINGVTDAAGFRKSEGQITASMIRALRRGQRNV